MNAYLPNNTWPLSMVVAILAFATITGYFVAQMPSLRVSRWTAWSMVVYGVILAEQTTGQQPAGFRMLAIIAVLLLTMKVVVTTEVYHANKGKLTFWQWLSFACLWVGMRPAIFRNVPGPPRTEVGAYMWRGFKNIAIGIFLALSARYLWLAFTDGPTTIRRILPTILLLPGISLILHFGIFNLLTAWWRWMGAQCDTIFREPLQSISLVDFWGRRWNLAFSEMTTLAVHRPLRGTWGHTTATLMSFTFSGLLHELAISLPVRAGFGGPMLYFLVHGIGMSLETRWSTLSTLIQRHPHLGRLWTFLWIVLPLPILFHRPFLAGCVWPLVGLDY
ncbi:MAG: membrane bound O-acyl transferase family-domain-containing protein [Pirellulaceae bacterium]